MIGLNSRDTLRMCLFGGEIGWMENFEEKMGRKTFLSVFSWVGRNENKQWGSCVFSLGLSKSFLPKMERKLNGENETVLMDKNAHVQFIYLFFIFLCWARCLFSFLFLFFPQTLLFFFLLFLISCLVGGYVAFFFSSGLWD